MARDLLAPIPFREVFVILALFLPQLSFVDDASARKELWSSPSVRKRGLVVDITPTAAGLQGMREYRIAFPAWSQAATFCPAHLQSQDFEQLATNSSNAVHMGCQVGKAYRLVLQENDACYSVLALLLAFVTPSRRKKGEESLREKLRRMSSPRHWDVALVPFPADFAPPPAPAETGLACPVKWEFPPSLHILESRATQFRVLAFAEVGDTVTADHLLQMATLAAEHKPTVLGIPGHVPIPYNLECTIVMLQSLHALFQLLTTGGTLMYCPQASDFAKVLGTAARHDNGHIVSLAASLALALRSGRSTLAVAGVFGAGKNLKIAVVHKENPAGRAITKLLTAFELKPDRQRYFVRPVSREEAEANTACTSYDLRAGEAAPYIPGCKVVIVTTGLVWDQKGQTHSTLNTHMENVDLLISEEAQQDKVKAESPFARQLQSTYSDLSSVDLDLPVGLLVGLGYAATCPDSPFDFRQAQSAAERSGVASPHCWSLMLPTSARVAQEVYEPLIGIQYPMLCSRLGDTWQIGTTSIREDHLIASGLRFVQWRHASPKIYARKEPKNNPTVKVYQLLEDELAKARAGTEGILALTNTREAAQNLRNYFEIA